MADRERLDVARTALIVYDSCRRALTPRTCATAGHAAGPRCLGAADQHRPGGLIAHHLYDAREPGGWRGRRPLAHRPERGDRHALPDELRRGQRRCEISRRDRPAARGLRLPEAPAERVLWHAGSPTCCGCSGATPSSSAGGPPIAASRRPCARRSARTSAWSSSASAARAATPGPRSTWTIEVRPVRTLRADGGDCWAWIRHNLRQDGSADECRSCPA